ncbi:MAG: SagB family peptide dehydrogenase [Deltaproteobacteria bacterium]|nr:SagB family peptide dehydrogenase [Deltaproteobacteria bacterium]
MFMKNCDLQAAWAYHNGTKHSYESIRTNPHYLDWETRPIPFKIYSKLEPIPLPQHLSSSGLAALSAISSTSAHPDGHLVLKSETLAEILFLSAGITKRRRHPGGEILYRAAACTGALYHIDLYLVCSDLPGLVAGVYHFGPHDFALRRLRMGDHRAILARATGGESPVVSAPAIVICASTYWRNAWKYQARAYRHCYWDNGTILANLLAAAASRNVAARVIVGFKDTEVCQLLGLDTKREGALTLVPLGDAPAMGPGASPEVKPLTLETVPLSKREVDYPAIRDMHEASSLESEEEVAAWRGQPPAASLSEPKGSTLKASSKGHLFPLRPLGDHEIPRDTIEEVILRRGSTRQFSHDSITFTQLSTMLDRATRGIAADFLDPGAAPLNDLYLIIHAVDDLPAGAYVFHRDRLALELLTEGHFRREAEHLGLGQDIPADASVDVFFLADLNPILERFGNRGYRAAQLEASITGGKLYLLAYALRLGASGLTFFDDDVTEFFSPHAAGKNVMFLIALGKSTRRSR